MQATSRSLRGWKGKDYGADLGMACHVRAVRLERCYFCLRSFGSLELRLTRARFFLLSGAKDGSKSTDSSATATT